MARAKSVSDHVTVRVLGATEITVGTRRIGMSTEALFALALYLTARAGERIARDEILDTFWPGGEEESRRHAMRQMLYRLRQKGFVFEEEADSLRLDPAKVVSDLGACLAAAWPESATADAVDAALALGPTFSARLPRAFLEWFDGIRTQVSHQARKAAMQLIASARSQGRWADLDRWARAVLSTDPLHEEATLARAEAAAMTGAKSLALEILDGYLAELGDVDASVGKPAQQLRKRIAERRVSWIPTGPREVPLVGREEEMSVLTQAVEAAVQGKGRSVLLVGPSGYGKSRLLTEAREYAALRGVRSVVVRAEATAASHPWWLFRELATALSSQPGAAGTDPRAMELLRPLVGAQTEYALSFAPATATDDIRGAVVSLIQAVSDESKLLIAIDDLHYADQLSLDSVSLLLSEIQHGRCTCIAAAQPSVVSRLTTKHRGPGVRLLSLGPLSDAAVETLARSTALAHSRELSRSGLEAIAERASGHPLFARELALSNPAADRTSGLPASLADLVARSLASLPQEYITVLRVISLLGECATTARVRQVTRHPYEDFIVILDALASHGLVHVDHKRALRLHDSWRDAVLAGIPDAACSALALECAEVLSSSGDSSAAHTDRLIADLYSVAGEFGKKRQYLLKSIDGLIAAGLFESAIELFDTHQNSFDDPVTSARFRVREAVSRLGYGEPQAALQVANRVWRSRVLQSSDAFSDHVLAVCVAADCHIKTDRADSGPAEELISIARNKDLSPRDRARACLWGIQMVSNARKAEALVEFASIATHLRDDGFNSPHSALTTLIFAAEAGSVADILEALESVRQVEQGNLTIWDRCLLLRCCAHALRIAGNLEESAATAEAAYVLGSSHGLDYSARLSAELLCNLHLDYGMQPEATAWFGVLSSGPEQAISSTTLAIGHVRDRIDFATGNLCALLERLPERLLLIRGIGETHGRASELSLAAAVLAVGGERSQAVPVLQSAIEAVEPFVGRHAADFAIDTCLVAAKACGGLGEAERLGVRHLQVRANTRGLPIPRGFANLSSLAAS